MKIIHISDLHLGIKLFEYSLIEEQAYFLENIITLIRDEKADALIIAGDVYDKATPQVEAVRVFDEFIVKLAELNIPVFIISGNHDSAVRLSFAGRILATNNIYISPSFDGEIKKIRIMENNTDFDFYLLPFVRASTVRTYFDDCDAKTYDEAVRFVLGNTDVDEKAVNILVSHQFVAGGSNCDSDDINVGGIDNVRADAFDKFDYVALGHLHNPQYVQRPTVRYAGSPLKYSLSEVNVKKTVTIVDITDKENILVTEKYIKPLRDVKKLEGSFDELMSRSFYEEFDRDDYFFIVLTDEMRIYDAMRKLKIVYPNILSMRYKNALEADVTYSAENLSSESSPFDIVSEFFELRNGYCMNVKQQEVLKNEIEMIWSGEYETD